MKCLDASFLIDYLAEADDGPATEYLERHESEVFCASTVVLFEVYCGPSDAPSPPGFDTYGRWLDWVDPVAVTDEVARTAAGIVRASRGTGTGLSPRDSLVAATASTVGATLVTNDSDFETVEGLDVDVYR